MSEDKRFTDEEQWRVPERFRVSMDKQDAEAYERLIAVDRQQRSLYEQFGGQELVRSIADPNNAVMKRRASALQAIISLKMYFHQEPTAYTVEYANLLAEYYAQAGMFATAEDVAGDVEHQTLYARYWEAIERSEGCTHNPKHHLLRERIYSLFTGTPVYLLGCSFCGVWWTQERLPQYIQDRKAREIKIIQETRGMEMNAVKAYLERGVKR